MSFATLTPAQDDPWATHYAAPGGYRWWPSEELVRAVGGRALGDVLEVGCGNGANLWFLASKTRGRVVGLDASATALDKAIAYTRDKGADVELVLGDIARLPFPDASFDSLVDCMVSQHAPWAAHPALYKEYRRVLRPGGWLFLYHLTDRTTCCEQVSFDHPRVDLFPAAGLTCLPPGNALQVAVAFAGFTGTQRGGMTRTYPAGQVADYAVVTGTAA